jgi:DNA-binding LytR/AlgR family response regulator
MRRKLRCVIVDDDPEAHHTIINQLKDSSIGEIIQSFYKPSDFLDNIYELDFDVVLLDILFNNDRLQGFDVAQVCNAENKVIVFISGSSELIVEACKYVGAIDVVPKPNTKERLNNALVKTWKILFNNIELPKKEHELFFVAERKEQISLLLSDIIFVRTAIGDHRNKEVIIKNGGKLTLMNCTFRHLLQFSNKLVQINISELISYDIVESVFHDIIYIKTTAPKEIPRILTLSKTHRSVFKLNFV